MPKAMPCATRTPGHSRLVLTLALVILRHLAKVCARGPCVKLLGGAAALARRGPTYQSLGHLEYSCMNMFEKEVEHTMHIFGGSLWATCLQRVLRCSATLALET